MTFSRFTPTFFALLVLAGCGSSAPIAPPKQTANTAQQELLTKLNAMPPAERGQYLQAHPEAAQILAGSAAPQATP